MKVSLWGTRGSIASPGPDTIRYGGNTTCVSVEGSQGTLLILDAGTGIRCLGQEMKRDLKRIDILLTHLHMDHIQGLPFFAPLRRPGIEVHIWGPASTTLSLRSRLLRYLSPPLFPISVREILSDPHFHELPGGTVKMGELSWTAQMVIHFNPTLGFRIQESDSVMTFLPDHEPALSAERFPRRKEWTSGYDLAKNADLLIHDAQYTDAEYIKNRGFGHSSIRQAFQFAELCEVNTMVPFHHDPGHDDDMLDQMMTEAIREMRPSFEVSAGKEGVVFEMAGEYP